MADSRLKDIFTNLKQNSIDAYLPGVKVGECLSRYAVVKYDGSSRYGSFSTNRVFYTIMCYVPKEEYSELETFISEVEKAMKKLEPMIKPTNSKTPSYFDESVKGHMVSIGYSNYRKQ